MVRRKRKELLVRRLTNPWFGSLGPVKDKAALKSLKVLGENLSRLRREAGLSQDQLAVKADLTKRYVQMLEAGQKCPTLFAVKRLYVALSCSAQDLFDGFLIQQVWGG